MNFDELYDSLVLTEKSVLQLVDEYTLYCFYTKIDDLKLNKAYSSPYRVDEFPSFSVYLTKYNIGVEYYWKDSATGESGNIFKLIQKTENLTSINDVLKQINSDFELGYEVGQPIKTQEKINLYERPTTPDIKIRVTETPLSEAGKKFWSQFSITNELLSFYKTSQIQYYWSYPSQEIPYVALDPTFAYRIGEYYQIYSPYASKEYKFRNDLPEHYFFGYMQLSSQSEKLIIDKSCKDVIFCRKLGYDAVCGKSETTMIPESKMNEFKKRYNNVYLMLDNDNPGRNQAKKYLELYPWLKPRFIPNDIAKDKTDCCKAIGFEQTKQLLNNLIQ